MANNLSHEDYRIDIAEVIKKLQQINATQPEIDLIVDAIKYTKTGMHVFLYLLRYCLDPENNIPNSFVNLISMYAYCLSGTPYHQSIIRYIDFFSEITKSFTGLVLAVFEPLEKNGYPTDPETMGKIMDQNIEEYFTTIKTQTSTD